MLTGSAVLLQPSASATEGPDVTLQQADLTTPTARDIDGGLGVATVLRLVPDGLPRIDNLVIDHTLDVLSRDEAKRLASVVPRRDDLGTRIVHTVASNQGQAVVFDVYAEPDGVTAVASFVKTLLGAGIESIEALTSRVTQGPDGMLSWSLTGSGVPAAQGTIPPPLPLCKYPCGQAGTAISSVIGAACAGGGIWGALACMIGAESGGFASERVCENAEDDCADGADRFLDVKVDCSYPSNMCFVTAYATKRNFPIALPVEILSEAYVLGHPMQTWHCGECSRVRKYSVTREYLNTYTREDRQTFTATGETRYGYAWAEHGHRQYPDCFVDNAKYIDLYFFVRFQDGTGVAAKKTATRNFYSCPYRG